MVRFIIVLLLFVPILHAGERPYEMVRAGRDADTHPPLVDFQNVDGWTVETVESEAMFTRSDEQRIFGEHTAKLVYRAAPAEAKKVPTVLVKPPQPIDVPMPFDCVNWWVYGNNWAWESDASTPRVGLSLILRGNENREVRIHMDTVRWREWFLMHRKLSAEQLKQLGDAPKLEAIEIRGGSNKDDRVLYFGNLSFYKEELKPLSFEPRPKRGIELPEGQGTGNNTGPEKLPFPNREETILPTNLESGLNTLTKSPDGKAFWFSYGGKKSFLNFWYQPKTGRLDDLRMEWGTYSNSSESRPYWQIVGGGPKFVEEPKEPPKLVSIKEAGNVLVAQWKFDDDDVEYRFQMKGKSLIVDVRCKGGNVKEFSSGGWSGLENPKLVQVPYLVGNGKLRPAVVVSRAASGTANDLFILSQLDHTRSNASQFFWENKVDKESVSAAACSRYNPKTDGTRNDCFERLFITVSPVFEEVLPNIPNDPSPWQQVTGERVWRAHGSSVHENDFKYWSRIHRYGVRKMLITDHEVMWRDGGESFTFRTSAAPGRGGDEGHKEYTKNIHGLGYVYGPYNNYTDYAPVNEYWHEDRVTRLSDGNFQPAWARCYNPKPAVAVELEPKITEIVQKKFNFNTAYCDVHTAVMPWQYVDYDARVPGAGTFAATYYAYGEIMLHQKKIWGGPVYSEGNNHWYYSGLTDGNYAQDQAYFVHQNGLPWLVDFDLLKMHPLENNFGMGYLNMFYGKDTFRNEKDKNTALDRFLAATLAFGHTGFLAMECGFSGGLRSYFAVQQVAKRYANQRVKSIRYADETGDFLTTSEAVASAAVNLNRIRVEYEDGLTLFVNGNEKLPWDVFASRKGAKDAKKNEESSFAPSRLCESPVPPNGWYVHDPKGEITAWSLDRDGCRTDYVDAPDYLFAEVRDNPEGRPQRFDRLLCDRQLIVLKNVDGQGKYEMIVGEPNYAARSTLHAVRLDNNAEADVVALDFNRKKIGKAETRYSRGMVHVMPVDGAFSYLLTPIKKEKGVHLFGTPGPHSDQTKAVPGEQVMIQRYDVIGNSRIPLDVKPGTLYWFKKDFDKKAIDFEIVPLCDVSVTFDPGKNRVDFRIQSNVTNPMSMMSTRVVVLCGEKVLKKQEIMLDPQEPSMVSCAIVFPETPTVLPLELRVLPGEENVIYGSKPADFIQNYWLKTDLGFAELPPLSENFELGQCQRGKQPTAFDGKSGAYAYMQTVACGDTSRKAWAIHPPYMGGVGYVYLLSEPFAVPDEPDVAFSSEVGIRNGGDASDGVLYQVFVVEDDNSELRPAVAEINWAKREWTPLIADLTPWRGKTIRLRLIADVGPKDNSSADWACWSEFKLVSRKPTLRTTLHEETVELTYIPAAEPIQSLDDFTKAEKVELFYEGCGMDASDRYHSTATLNGVGLGRLPGAWGNETKGEWAKASVTLPPEAVKSLGEINRLEIRSAEDCFKVRRFQIVATLSDGTKRSTMLTNRTVTHPGSWKYTEGETVPMGQPIAIDIFTK